MAGRLRTAWINFRDAAAASVKGLSLRDPISAWLAGTDAEDGRKHVRNPLEEAVYIYTAIAAIARAVTRIRIQIVSRNTRDPLPDEAESVRVLGRPNLLEDHAAFFDRTVKLRYRDGLVYWVMPDSAIPGTRPVVEIARAKEVAPRVAGGMLVGWDWRREGEGHPRELRLDQVARLYFPHPDDPMKALSPLTAAQLSVDQHVFSSKYGASVFLNGAHIGVTFATDKSLTPEQREQIESSIKAKWGSFINAGKPMVLWGGLKAEPPPQTMQDLDMSSFKELTRNEQIAPLMVPPMFAAIYDDATFNNTRQQELFFWDMTGLAEAEFLVNAWNAFVQTRLDDSAEAVVMESSVHALKERSVEFAAKALDLQKFGIPLNDIIRAYGLELPEQPWGDVPLVSPALVPITLVMEEAAAAAAADNAPEGAPAETPDDEDDEEDATEEERAWRRVLTAADTAGEESRTRAREDAIAARWFRSWAKLRREARGAFRMFIRRQRDAVLARLQRAGLPQGARQRADQSSVKQSREAWLKEVLLNLEFENNRLKLVAQFVFTQGAEFGGEQAAREAGADEAVQFNLDNRRVREHLERQAIRVRRINAVTNRALRRTLLDGLDGGESLTQLSERVAKAMNVRADAQTYRIANTEMHEAVSAGRHEGLRQVGIKTRRWLTSGRGVEPGGPVRKSHFYAEQRTRREPIGINERFELYDPDTGDTSRCDFPGQGMLPPSERIHCACMELAVDDAAGRALGLEHYERHAFLEYGAWQKEKCERAKASK